MQYIQTAYKPIGGHYFTDEGNIMSYSLDTKKFSSVLDTKTNLSLHCKDVSYYEKEVFCHDIMRFIGPKTSDIQEEILAINDNIVVTPKYIYNQDSTNTSWKYFEYQTGALHFPESVVHINKIPYLFG